MASTEVRPVRGRSDFHRFIDYAYEINARDPHWIPPLRMSERERLTPGKNPFFAHADIELLLAWRGREVVGRVGAIDDRLHNQTHADNVAMFGFFEAADGEAARTLLDGVEAWARQRGRARVRGPLNPSLNESAGLLVDGFDTDPMLLMPHNPPSYARFIEQAGYGKAKDLFAWLHSLDVEFPAATAKLADRVRDRLNLVVRPLNLKEFAREVERLRMLYCGAWEHNWGFVPPTEEEFTRIASEMRPIFDPRCAICAEIDGRMVACAIAIPDINQALKGTNGRLNLQTLWRLIRRSRHIDQARLLLLGVDAAYRPYGLYPLMLFELHRQMTHAYRRVEFSWVLEDNHNVNRPAADAGARLYKTYRIYEKALS
jgi:hypothetical protein